MVCPRCSPPKHRRDLAQLRIHNLDDSAVYVLVVRTPGLEEARLFPMKGMGAPDALQRGKLYHWYKATLSCALIAG
jgi:hypothetical protein